jgi:hypothetical protein
MNHKTAKIVFLFAMIISLSSCYKEVDLLGDYKDIPIIYGFIDANDSISYLRIQKAFLSDGNIFEDAQIPDSNLYEYKLDVSIKSGNRVIKFDTTSIHDKDDGVFFSPDMPLYYAVTKDLLNTNVPLHLEVKNPKTGNIATSTANLMDASQVQFIRPTHQVSLHENFRIEYITAPDIRIYQLVIRFNYMEMRPYDTASQEFKYVDWLLPPEVSTTDLGGESMNFYFRVNTFLDNLLIKIPKTTTLHRLTGDIELIVKTSEQAFHTYYEAYQPNNSVIAYDKNYTNITNGHGLFVGKSSKTRVVRIHIFSKPLLWDLEGLNFIGSIPEEDDDW